jgi:hypothetical protein
MQMNIQIAPLDDINSKLNFSMLSEVGLTIRFTTVPVKDKRFAKLAFDENCNFCAVNGPSAKSKCKYCGGTGFCKVVSAARIRYNPNNLSHLDALTDFLYKHESLVLNRYTTTVELKEFGGLDKDGTGRAVVVCGTHGEKLRCAYSGSQPNGVHAVFYVTIALVVDDRYKNDKHVGNVSLVAVERLRKDQKFRLSKIFRPLFKFYSSNGGAIDYDEMTNTKIEFPGEAVKAAMQKAMTPDCTTSFYCLCSKELPKE